MALFWRMVQKSLRNPRRKADQYSFRYLRTILYNHLGSGDTEQHAIRLQSTVCWFAPTIDENGHARGIRLAISRVRSVFVSLHQRIASLAK
jgi:hypothetical protein